MKCVRPAAVLLRVPGRLLLVLWLLWQRVVVPDARAAAAAGAKVAVATESLAKRFEKI